jgi:hypothetical protein
VIRRGLTSVICPNSGFLSCLAALWHDPARVRNDNGFYLTDADRELARAIETNLNLRELLYYRIGFAQC